MAPDTSSLIAAILQSAWMVRHYARGARQRSSRVALLRQQAIQQLGLTVREAFNKSNDFEPLLQAIVDGLVPLENTRF
jgi:hypothetical protein